ncbi:MAG: DegV family protein [Anaerolineales bacterium]|jgi:DegV family protein with EDD domain|nr:DegV family protein [Anaerolineales bacterium]
MKIITDCAADMPIEELQANEITQAPLLIQFPEGEINSADIAADDFYNRLEKMRPAIPTTAQPSSGVFANIYRELATKDRQLLSIHISSGLSGTINSARLGAEQVSGEVDVTVWDTLTLSGGERFQVLAAAWANKAGWALEAIQERLAKIRAKTEVIYTLETLEYLARGGRIGRVQALAGAILNLKPIINVDHEDGKYNTVSKARTIPRAIQSISDFLHETYQDAPLWVTVLHGRFAEKAEDLSKELSQRLNIARREVLRISPVLGVHTGPGIVGAAILPMELMSDLI